ncbi:hypothetical protein KQH82_08425 [bacterium]|nr:hypothetical protein [bacterium]
MNAIPDISARQTLIVVSLIAACLLISIWLQVQVSPSPMTQSEDIWQQKLDMHLHDYPFSVRPLQSYTTLSLHTLTGIPVRESFFIIQFLLAGLLGLAFYRLMRQMAFDHRWSSVGVLLLMTSYPIIGAHWEPTHTWDDIWAYLFLVLTVTAALAKKPTRATLWLILAILAREPVAVFYPVFAYLIVSNRNSHSKLKLALCLAAPVLFTIGMRLIFTQPMDIWRWPVTILGNFGDPLRINDTVVSVIIAFGFMWLVSAIGLFRTATTNRYTSRDWLLWAWLITVPITLYLSLTGSLARETRILFPPFVCVIPLSVLALQYLVNIVRPAMTRKLALLLTLGAILSVTAGVIAANTVLFPTFHYTANERIRRPLAGFHLGATAALSLVFVYGFSRRPPRSPSRHTS